MTCSLDKAEIKQFARLINEAKNIVVLTGAGISTESGIPDFRSPGGIWSKFRIIDYNEYMASEDARMEDWKRRLAMGNMFADAKPNKGHEVLADWVKTGKCSTIITQNIDGLHEETGVPEEAIIEIHGTGRHAVCTACGKRHEIAECHAMIEANGHSPTCTDCGEIVKSAVVMFGQSMPQREMLLAYDAAQKADLFVAVGTSLVVFPAAELPMVARKAGAKLVIISAEPTQLDHVADLAINASAGEALAAASLITD